MLGKSFQFQNIEVAFPPSFNHIYSLKSNPFSLNAENQFRRVNFFLVSSTSKLYFIRFSDVEN